MGEYYFMVDIMYFKLIVVLWIYIVSVNAKNIQEKSFKQEFYKNGIIKKEIIYNSKGEEEKKYDLLGRIKEQNTYQKGLLNGIKITFYTDGDIKCMASYFNGQIYGVKTCYFPNHRLERIIFYDRKGKKQKIEKFFNKKSNGIYEIRNIDDKKKNHGKQTLFYKNGQIQEECFFEHGNPIGVIKKYTFNGKLISSKKFREWYEYKALFKKE